MGRTLGREGKGREGDETKGKEREGKGREGKGKDLEPEPKRSYDLNIFRENSRFREDSREGC